MSARSQQAVTRHGQPIAIDYRHFRSPVPGQPEHPGPGRQHDADPVPGRPGGGQAPDQLGPAQRPATHRTPGAEHPVRYRHRARPQRHGDPPGHDQRRPPTPAAAGKPGSAGAGATSLDLAFLHFRMLAGTLADLALRVFDLHRGKLRGRVAHHQHGKGQQQDAAAQVDDPQVRRIVVGDVGDQQPGQCRDRHVDQETHRHVVGLEQV